MSMKLMMEKSSHLKYNITFKIDSVGIKENSNTEYLGNFDKATSSLKFKSF